MADVEYARLPDPLHPKGGRQCLCDWQGGVCRYQPKPPGCRGPHASDNPSLWDRVKRWLTDEEGF